MSKKAEEAALKMYPIKIINGGSMLGSKYDSNMIPRYYFINGYEQAEKDTIERAIKWLEENVWESTGLDFQILTESFKNAVK